ncbi:Hypothetical protein CINCED_3A021312 [Cinara cedri]|uniref:Transmembrane protein 177 n=1 Tax=Cinara cedri TaxID=506608 RepID=A0A5E4M462_9HEMI|nr:Hypothetical protein CINCED_3A021312 [Cinara cedri]
MKILNLKITSDFIVNSLCTLTLGVGVAEYTTNVLLTNVYVKYFKEEYKNGHPVPLSESLRKRYDSVVQDLKYTEFQKAFSTPFIVESLKPTSIGCLNTRSGSYIGIPNTYELNTINDISVLNVDNSELQTYIQLMNDNTEFGQKFMESLILSEPAKKYSIAREMILADNYRLFIKSLSCPGTLIPMYALGSTILSAIPPNPVKIRALAFFLLCNVGVILWLFIRTAIEYFYQSEVEKTICDIGEEYIHGGIEYNKKLIQRNLALRNIIPDGRKIISEEGNEIPLFSIFTESLHHKIKYLEHRLKECKDNKNETLT